MRKILKVLTSKFLLVCILLLLELAFIPTVILLLTNYVRYAAEIVALLLVVLDIVLTLYIIHSDMNAEYKIAWIVPILALPPFGALLYVMLRRRKSPRRKLKALLTRVREMEKLYEQPKNQLPLYDEKSDFARQCADYIHTESLLPATGIYEHKYFSCGEEYFAALTEELSKAEKFIFLEYFILRPGKFWNSVLAILEQKAKEGVDVRVIYDDIGSILKVPDNYAETLEKSGIKCLCFNRFRPVLDVAQNNRTHRKIAVIDGKTAFTGGINLSDEYINETHPFGKWKDTGIMIRGNAVQNFTALFFQLWALKSGDEDYERFLSPETEVPCSRLCIPFGDSPFDGERNVCEDLLIKIIYNAKRYVYVNTPYLVIDGEMKRALITAARSGVDVRIAIPAVPDKKYVYSLTKAFSSQLLKEGIRVFRYTPGFLHAKSVVSDGVYGVIGSTNMDFRSFYLHYECNVAFFDEQIAADLEKDFTETLKECEELTPSHFKNGPFRMLYRAVLRLFAPLM